MNLSYKDWWCDEFVSGGYMPWHKETSFKKKSLWVSFLLVCRFPSWHVSPNTHSFSTHLVSTSSVSDAVLHLQGVNKAEILYSRCLEFTLETWLYMVQIKNAMKGSGHPEILLCILQIVWLKSNPVLPLRPAPLRGCVQWEEDMPVSHRIECLSLIH